MKKILTSYLALLILFTQLFVFIRPSFAAPAPPSSTSPGSSDIFGTIEEPAGVDKYNAQAGESGIGIIVFISNLIKLATVVAGVWTMVNFVLAGWIYITDSGSKDAHSKVSDKMIKSAIGLIIIATAYTIAGLISLLIFGDPKFILEPTFTGIK